MCRGRCKLTKTDNILLALGRTIPKYLSEVGSFQHKGKKYLLENNFVSSHSMKCNVCGNNPIINISIIRNEEGRRLNTCNACIDRITNQNVSRWFKTYRKKRENIMENRNYIDCLSLMLAAYERNERSFTISSEDVEKLKKTYVQMCNGLNPTTKQKQLAEHYISYNAEILHGKKD
jgi:hypothetical protein